MGIEASIRYWAKVDKRADDECWPWKASRNDGDYGMFRPGDGEQLAHRYAYRLAHGEIPAGLQVCHHCDNPPCQNPAHFFLGTHADNMADRRIKGRSRTRPQMGERNGMSRYTDAEVMRMCEMYRSGLRQVEIAEQFATTQNVVSKLLRTRGGIRLSVQRRARGLRNVNGKLTDDEVREIRRAYAAKEASQSALGVRFGVSQVNISSIVRGKHRTLDSADH